MQHKNRSIFHILIVTLFVVLLATACTSAGSQVNNVQSAPQATEAMGDEMMDDEMMEASPDEEMMASQDEATMEDGEHDDADMIAEDQDETMMEGENTDAMDTSGEGEMMDDAGGESMQEDSMSGDGMMEAPEWFSTTLTNVNQDTDFTINDYQGKVVLVETMAVWCTNCLSQQKQVRELHNLLGERDDFVSIGLDIDPNENETDLAAYTANQGFDWVYAVAPAEVSRELSQLYGVQFLNPPSTPILIIDRHGEAHPLPFGIKSAADLQAAVEPLLAEGM